VSGVPQSSVTAVSGGWAPRTSSREMWTSRAAALPLRVTSFRIDRHCRQNVAGRECSEIAELTHTFTVATTEVGVTCVSTRREPLVDPGSTGSSDVRAILLGPWRSSARGYADFLAFSEVVPRGPAVRRIRRRTGSPCRRSLPISQP